MLMRVNFIIITSDVSKTHTLTKKHIHTDYVFDTVPLTGNVQEESKRGVKEG